MRIAPRYTAIIVGLIILVVIALVTYTRSTH
jgi:hypothetical protein